MTKKEYNDIPGTFVFDADRSREGYHLNQFCISLRLQENRERRYAESVVHVRHHAARPDVPRGQPAAHARLRGLEAPEEAAPESCGAQGLGDALPEPCAGGKRVLSW